ncbi:class I SAM-dependent methyltransferase [Paenibacillus dendritiformis]|uniref:class I SAM-dependent methyltransferase n=1 Tax=Paenibacillus dendritiformis TaxID=130049 RepID=UPI0030B897A5
MYPKLEDPRNHQEWVTPHSFAWYAQIAELSGAYAYSWNSTITEPNAEVRFEQEVRDMVRDRIVLDIGCGHGEFTAQMVTVREANHRLGCDERIYRARKEAASAQCLLRHR